MAHYAIMRCAKLKGMGSVAASLSHCFRERETPNADDQRTPENEHMRVDGVAIDSTDTAMGRLRERLPEKRRKDAVLCVEYVMTASPEWWETASSEQQKAFFQHSLEWLADKYGQANIVAASVHRDEQTPHLSAYVVPLTTDGRLSAKEHIGNRTQMSNDQTTFAGRVAHLGLERGIEGSKATHQRVKRHYAAIEEGQKHQVTIEPGALEPKVLKKGFFRSEVESLEGVSKRISSAVNAGFQGVLSRAAESEQNAQRARDMADTANTKQQELEKERHRVKLLQRPWEGLTKDDMRGLIEQAEKIRQQRETERKRVALEKARREQEERQRRAEEQTARKMGIKTPQNSRTSDERPKDDQTPGREVKRPTGRSRRGMGR
ncbi:MobV family relaxase [Halomonas sp. AOP23-I1-17]|uniref:MobV family relaxase n=5 Tax=unclassified Halomonas TaxID=2609666 RepID=UPI004034CA0D